MEEVTFMTVCELAHAIRERTLSAREVLEAHLAQIERHNPTLKAIVTLDESGARTRARPAEADAALARGEVWGPLHGVPVTLKDFHTVAGLRCTSGGHPARAHYIAPQDSAVPARLRRAGAVILGMTNLQFTPDSIFEPSRNPWDLARTPGTSSSGAAAAVAAGLSPLDIGSDGGGSVTAPAHFTGICGMRPTEHRVSMAGLAYYPEPAPLFRILGVLGPMARSVADLRLALEVIAGPDLNDPAAPPVPWREVPLPAIDTLRVAWTPAFLGTRVAKDIRRALEAFVQELAHQGARVEQWLPEADFAAQQKLFERLGGLLFGAFQPLADGTSLPLLADYLLGLHERDAFIALWEQFFANWDVLLCPPTFRTAPPLDETVPTVDGEVVEWSQQISVAALFSLTGHPSVVIPLGKDRHNLPLGVQIVGRRWEDEHLLAIAEVLSQLTGGFEPPPGY